MTLPYSPKLRNIIDELKPIFLKHNIMGAVVLADGEGFGEYYFDLDSADWSKIKMNKGPNMEASLTVGIHMKSDPENSNKTVNAIFNMTETLNHTCSIFNSINKCVKSKVDVAEDDGSMYYGNRLDGPLFGEKTYK